MLLLVTVHGEQIELDMPPAEIERLCRVARREGKRPGKLAREVLEQAFPEPQTQKSPAA